MALPQGYVEEGLELSKGMLLFGEPVDTLTREELIACVAQFADALRERNAQDRQQAAGILCTPYLSRRN